MDEGLRQVLKTEQDYSSSKAALATQRSSAESESEHSVQETAYQQQRQMCIYYNNVKDNTASSQQDDGEDEYTNNEETEDFQIYDSLEVASHLPVKRNLAHVHTEYLDTQTDEGTSQLISDDAYSDLRYDPNWRTNLKKNGCFIGSPPISNKQVPEEINAGYRYITDTSPAVVVTHNITGSESDQPYHLHPQGGQTSSVTAPHFWNHALQLSSPTANISRLSSSSNKNESENTSKRRFTKTCEDSCNNAGKNISRSPQMTEDIRVIESLNQYHQGGCIQTQKMDTSTATSPKLYSNRKLGRLMEDIVERNKVTLGCNMSRCDSYVKVHALKQDMPYNLNKETDSTEHQEDSSDPEMRWLEKTQQLQIIKGKKAQRKYPSPSQKQQPPTSGLKAEQKECLSSMSVGLASATQPKPQMTGSSQPLPPTINLSINLNTSSHLLSLLQHKGQDAIINLATLGGHPHWSPASEVQLTSAPGYQQTDLVKFFKMPRQRLNSQCYQQHLENSSEQRTTALKLPLSCEGTNQDWSLNEAHTKLFPQIVCRTLTPTSSHRPGSYTVLPPIGKPMTGSPVQCVSTTYPILKNNDSYLLQMEKQKQLKARVTYKTYSLKDFKQLKPDANLQGQGPDHTTNEKTAEKMKPQKLYSNVIGEQNKKMMPFLLAKDPKGHDKKVPRIKALEYAKTIAKPPVQSRPKQNQKQQSEAFSEHTPYLQDLDMSQLATLELLKKRHEEEKQVVALFRKVHAV
ncbi:jhy protein homolog isoform X2 [Mastacembelus armatus]|uniref:Junctional cadherin complex regulator n=1 Tax=Mastacembelus armatus TaxID=205130 RepID=A0A3Q3KKD1_9TELE|nr:jhy protein homolog isoform X2 [Mastacembelus armatus]